MSIPLGKRLTTRLVKKLQHIQCKTALKNEFLGSYMSRYITGSNTLKSSSLLRSAPALAAAGPFTVPDGLRESHSTVPAPGLYRGLANFFTEYLPVEDTKRLLVYMHELTGLPWWASLLCSAFLFRLSVVPLTMLRLSTIGKFSRFAPHFVGLTQIFQVMKQMPGGHFYKRPETRDNILTVLRLYSKQSKRHGIAIRRLFYPMFLGIPLFLTFNLSVRHLLINAYRSDNGSASTTTTTGAATNDIAPPLTTPPPASTPTPPSDLVNDELFNITTAQLNEAARLLRTEGPFFCPDLTSNDPTAIIPAIAIMLTMFNIYTAFHTYQDLSKQVSRQYNVEIQEKSKTARVLLYSLQFCVLLSAPLSMYIPAYIYLYWSMSMGFSTIQNLITKAPIIQNLYMKQAFLPRYAEKLPFLLEPRAPVHITLPSLSLTAVKSAETARLVELTDTLRMCDHKVLTALYNQVCEKKQRNMKNSLTILDNFVYVLVKYLLEQRYVFQDPKTNMLHVHPDIITNNKSIVYPAHIRQLYVYGISSELVAILLKAKEIPPIDLVIVEEEESQPPTPTPTPEQLFAAATAKKS